MTECTKMGKSSGVKIKEPAKAVGWWPWEKIYSKKNRVTHGSG